MLECWENEVMVASFNFKKCNAPNNRAQFEPLQQSFILTIW